MSSSTIEYRVRIRAADDLSDFLVITSTRGGTNPYICDPPRCDGSEFDPMSGAYRSGTCTVRIADAITSGTDRVLTSQLEDAGLRQQLSSRPAYVEERINGGSWTSIQAGIVTGLRLSSPAVWDLDVGDATRATRNLTAFAPLRRAGDATKLELFTDYMTRWPGRGCLAGGPVIGGFLSGPDLLGWEVTVANVTGSGATRVVGLHFVAGYQVSADRSQPDFKRDTNANNFRDPLNEIVGKPSAYAASSFPDDFPKSPWADVIVKVGSNYFATAGVAVGPFLSERFFGLSDSGAELHVCDPNSLLTVASTVLRVRIFDAMPSERCPIYFSGHPIDLWTKLCTAAGLAYNSAAVETCRDALGRGMRIHLRITSTAGWASWVEGTLYGPCGFSVRTNSSNELVPFATRIITSVAPSTIVTSADVPSDGSVLFDLSEPDALTKVTFHLQNLLPNAMGIVGTNSGPRIAIPRTVPPPDGVSVQSVVVERTSGDASGPVQREQSYTIPGFLSADATATTYDPLYVDHFAAEIFDRMGRGRLSGEVSLLRAGTGGGLLLGDEFACAVPSMPNHNKRYKDDNTVGGRCVQIVRSTPTPSGPRVRFLDSGPNANAVATLPTVTITAGTAAGSVSVTITNAATLNANSIAVRLYWAVTTGAAPATADYTAVTYFAAGVVPTTAFALPTVTPGRTVYVLGRGEKAGSRPSTNGIAASVATNSIGAPGSFTATPDPSDGSRCVLAWATGTSASALLVDVFLRLTADSATNDVERITLSAGSTQYTLDDLTPSTNYTASVRHRDPSLGTLTAKTTVDFTTSGMVATLAIPVNPTGFAGEPGQGAAGVDGSYGLAVVATVIPGSVEFREAVEDSVGAGTFGAYSTVARTSAVLGNWTMTTRVAPNDGLYRRLCARSVSGSNSSSWTDPVDVFPWRLLELVPYTGPTAPTLTITGQSDASDGLTHTVYFTINDATAEVWAAQAVVTAPEAESDWATLATLVVPLADGTLSYTVTKPIDGQIAIAQLEPRAADLTVGAVRRIRITATPQVPAWEFDDIESTSSCTQWWKLTERGIAITTVDVLTQIGSNPVSAFGTPTRGPGDVSTVRGGVLGAHEYEQDADRDADRSTYIVPRATLETGLKVMPQDAMQFDRDLNPNILSVALTSGTYVPSILCDSDTKSITVLESVPAWSSAVTYVIGDRVTLSSVVYRCILGHSNHTPPNGTYWTVSSAWTKSVNGVYATPDLTATDVAGAVGLGASTKTYTITAYQQPIGYITGSTPYDQRTLTVSGPGAASPAAAWDTSVLAGTAPTVGTDVVTLTLKATGSVVGYTAKVYIKEGFSSNPVPTVDETSNLTPALTTPPTSSTNYSWSSAYTAENSGGTAKLLTWRARCDLIVGGSVVDSKTVTCTWWAL